MNPTRSTIASQLRIATRRGPCRHSRGAKAASRAIGESSVRRIHDTFWHVSAYAVGAVRASRLVSLLLLLQSRGGLTAAELARELEVSVRSIHRDVEALSAAGVPIYADRGPHGGIRLVDGYRTRLTGMTADEAEALFLSGLPGPAAELGLGTVVAAAQLKVMAALPTELRARASRLVQRFHLDPAGWFTTGAPVPHLAALAEAVWGERRIAIDYERGEGVVSRVVEPLGVVLKAGVWYLVASHDGQLRTYRGSRVTAVTRLDERFERPANFDLAAYWAESTAAYERDVPRVEVTVRIDPRRLERLRDLYGDRVVEAAERLDDPDLDGWLHLRLRLDWPEEVASRLLGLGPDLEVLEPLEVRSSIVQRAASLVTLYERTATAPPTATPVRARRGDRGRAASYPG
jgi:predicted DNA-binding transcriptional regulator YafY